MKTETQHALIKNRHYRLILRISFVRVPSRGFAKVPEQTIQKTEKQRRVWVRSGDSAECCSLMSKCHAEARQILRRSPNRSSHRQNGIYHKFQSLLCVLFDLCYKWNACILYKIGIMPSHYHCAAFAMFVDRTFFIIFYIERGPYDIW